MTVGGGITFTYLSQADQTTYANGLSVTKRTRYDYDALGHVVKVREYAGTTDSTLSRTTTTDYITNTGAWIVDTPKWVQVYAGDAVGGTRLKEVKYYYDRDQGAVRDWNMPPLRGELVFEEVNGFQPEVHTWTNKWYYSNGNLEATTDAKGNITRNYYDTTFNLYPTQIVNAKTQSTFMAYDLALGLVTQVTDPNNAVTQYQYDTFGRLLKVAKPYDNLNIPTVEYFYVDGYNVNGLKGLKIQTNSREVSGNTNAVRPIIQFYDGLGRLVQERAETVDGSQQSVTNVTYDARGLTRYTYTPAFESYSADFVRPSGWDSRAKTINDYDALGRPYTVTGPDNTATNYRYEIVADTGVNYLADTVIDANRHAKQNRHDSLGRLVKVLEFTGDCSQSGAWGFNCAAPYTTPWTEYGTTRYAYDVLDNLRFVTDTAQSTTVMTYNSFGQKIGMIDPDMGAWDYQYDAVGNLTVQDDAKHQRLCFFYDELNRLIGKSDTTDQMDCPAATTTYGYDAYNGTTQFGRGRRTSMTDQSGSTTWTYDLRGRVTQESKAINGASTYNTSYTYDAMDRVKTITYPTGEVVTQDYNAAGQINNVYGWNNYAGGHTYNALGQLTQMSYGNGTLIRLGYNGLGGEWDSEPASGLTSLGRLWRVRAQSSAGLPLYDVRYGYDKVGNVQRTVEAPRAATNWPSPYTLQDAMDSLSGNWVWSGAWSGHQSIAYEGSNGVVKNTGTGINFNATFYRSAYSLSNATGVQVRFKVDATNTQAIYEVEANDATPRRLPMSPPQAGWAGARRDRRRRETDGPVPRRRRHDLRIGRAGQPANERVVRAAHQPRRRGRLLRRGVSREQSHGARLVHARDDGRPDVALPAVDLSQQHLAGRLPRIPGHHL